MTSDGDVRINLKKAYERLESAEILYDAGNYDDSVSRSYYAVFDACRAALLTKDILPKTHAGTLTKFNHHFIKSKLMPTRFSKVLARIEKSRLNADYEFKDMLTKAEAKMIISVAEEFVKRVEKLLNSSSI